MSLLLPGQPIPVPRGPAPQLGPGTYVRDGQVRSSILGTPRFEGSVCTSPLKKMNDIGEIINLFLAVL